MHLDIDHLSLEQQAQLHRIVRMVFEEFENALALANTAWKKKGRIDKIVLYACPPVGCGKEGAPDAVRGTSPGYGILVIINDQRLTEQKVYWRSLRDRFDRDHEITGRLASPVDFVVHTLSEVNSALDRGVSFFMALLKDGAILYDYDGADFHTPRPRSAEQALAIAQDHFDAWFPSAVHYHQTALYALGQGWLHKAAFDMHQAAERLYHAVLLTLTFRAPNTHDLVILRREADRLDPRLAASWPDSTHDERRRFRSLSRAYKSSRYSASFRVAPEDLAWIDERLRDLASIVEHLCAARLSGAPTPPSAVGPSPQR